MEKGALYMPLTKQETFKAKLRRHNRLADPDGGYVLAEMIDISDEMAAQEALRAREQLLHRLTEALPTGVSGQSP